jgi:hypothetical protein
MKHYRFAMLGGSLITKAVGGRGRTEKVTKHESWSIITRSLVGR